jgi:hypothetical protein
MLRTLLLTSALCLFALPALARENHALLIAATNTTTSTRNGG